VHTGFRDIGKLGFWIFATLLLHNLHPELTVQGLRRGIGEVIVTIVFIPAGKKAVVAAVTFVHIY
jgi:hypothetical protein